MTYFEFMERKAGSTSFDVLDFEETVEVVVLETAPANPPEKAP